MTGGRHSVLGVTVLRETRCRIAANIDSSEGKLSRQDLPNIQQNRRSSFFVRSNLKGANSRGSKNADQSCNRTQLEQCRQRCTKWVCVMAHGRPQGSAQFTCDRRTSYLSINMSSDIAGRGAQCVGARGIIPVSQPAAKESSRQALI